MEILNYLREKFCLSRLTQILVFSALAAASGTLVFYCAMYLAMNLQ